MDFDRFFIDATPERDRSVLLVDRARGKPGRHIARVFDERDGVALAALCNSHLRMIEVVGRLRQELRSLAELDPGVASTLAAIDRLMDEAGKYAELRS